ncbi:MAG: TlpA family protein disulfide reductase [Bacteroidales bacterium]|jgi:peroxiredoxin|nr:TlpA family protein disulfide reductase [Bacteroidales bacterium]
MKITTHYALQFTRSIFKSLNFNMLLRGPLINKGLRYIFFYFATLLFFCPSALFAQKTTIRGKVENGKFTQVDLQLLYKEDGVSYGKSKVNPDGTFNLIANISQTDLYKLVFEAGKYAMLCLSPNQNIEITLNADSFSDIISVKGSPSIEFCKNAYNMLVSLNLLGDSVNRALQADKEAHFYTEFQSRFKPFFDTNSGANEYCLLVAKTTDSLVQYVNSKIVKSSVIPKEIDVFIYSASNLLSNIAINYSKYANYMQSIGTLSGFIENRNPKYSGFYKTTLDKYLEFSEPRNTIMKNSFSPLVDQINNYLSFRDSLIINDLAGKKKEKETLVAKIVEIAVLSPDAKELENSLIKNSGLADGYGKYTQQEAQRKASSVVQNYQKFFDSEREKRTNIIVDYMFLNKNDLAVLLFLDNFPRDHYQKLHNEVVKSLFEKYPNHILVKERNLIETSTPKSTDIGSIAPDLAFENPDGKILKLSDLRGKVVLLDFWAAWCRPCRQENPNVVKTYQKYQEKGFDVYSVSLDNDKAKWVKAIQDDGLVWPNHVSDLGYWQSKAANIYGVNSIPTTFLLDKEGRIIGKNLRGAALENALKEIFE